MSRSARPTAFRAVAPLKLSLAGEHAVGYGGSSVVAALDVELTLEVEEGEATASPEGRGRFQHGGRHCAWDPAELAVFRRRVDAAFRRRGAAAWQRWSDDFFAPFRYVAGLWLGRHRLPVFVARSADRGWSSSGLGTSSASTAALVRACATLAGETVDEDEIERQVLAADRLCHGGIPSGVDGAVVVRGGTLLYAAGARRELPSPELRVLLVHTGVQRSCNRVIAGFAAQPRARIDAFVRRMETVTTGVAEALTAHDPAALFAAIEADRLLLREYALSSPTADELAALARRAGAGAAKLTGAGVGGALFALFEDAVPSALVAALHRRGLPTIETRLGGAGCRII